jgi:hypothetical protein
VQTEHVLQTFAQGWGSHTVQELAELCTHPQATVSAQPEVPVHSLKEVTAPIFEELHVPAREPPEQLHSLHEEPGTFWSKTQPLLVHLNCLKR